MQMELNTAHAMVAKRDETIALLKQAAQDALIVNDSAVAESCALMELLRTGDWTAAGSSDAPMDDDASKFGRCSRSWNILFWVPVLVSDVICPAIWCGAVCAELEHQRDMAFLKQSLAELNTLDAESIARERIEAQALQGQVGGLTELASTQAHRIAELEELCQSHEQQRERHTDYAAELSSLKQAVVDLESANDQDATKAVTMQTGLRERIAELHGALEQQEAQRVSLEAQATLDRKKLADAHSKAQAAYKQQIKTLGHELQNATRQLRDQTTGEDPTADAVAVADEYLRRLQQRDADLQASRQSEMLATAELNRVSSEFDRVSGELDEAITELDRVSGELDRVTSEATSELLSAQEDSDATLRSFTAAHAETLRARDAQLRSLQEQMATSARHEVMNTADDVHPTLEEPGKSRHQLEALQMLVAQHAQELEKRDSDIQAAAEAFRQLENRHDQAAAEAASVTATLERQVQELLIRIAQQEPQPELRQDNAVEKKNQQLSEQNERLRAELTALLGETQHLRAQLAGATQQPAASPGKSTDGILDTSPREKRVSFDSSTIGSGPTMTPATAMVEGVEVSSALQTALWEKEEFRALAQLESSRLTQLKDECKNWLSEVSLLQNAFTEASTKLAAMRQIYGVVAAERDQLRAHVVNIQQQMGASTMGVLDVPATASEALDISAVTSTDGTTLHDRGNVSVTTGILDASAATSIDMALDDLRPRTALSERPRAASPDRSPGITISVTSPLTSATSAAGAILDPVAPSPAPGPAAQPAPTLAAPDLQQSAPARRGDDSVHSRVEEGPADTGERQLTPARQSEQPVDLSAISTAYSALSPSPMPTPQQARGIVGPADHTAALQGSRIKSVLDSYVAEAVVPPPLPTQLFDSISRFLEEEEQRESALLSAVRSLAEPPPEVPRANTQ